MLGRQQLRTARLVALAAALLATVAARAEPTRPWQIELNAGVAWAEHVVAGELGGFVGYYLSLGPTGRPMAGEPSDWGYFVSVGPRVGRALLAVDDPRGVGNTIETVRWSIGGEARVGVAFGHESPDFYAYLSAAPMYHTGATRLANLAEGGRGFGLRLAAGFAFPGALRPDMDHIADGGCDGGTCGLALFGYLVPDSLAITAEHVAGDSGNDQRYGFAVAYTF